MAGRAAPSAARLRVCMRLGLNLGYLVGSDDPRGQLRLAQHAEALGFAVVWAAEAYGSDSPTVLAWLAAQTSTIDVGSAVMQIPARTPAMTAMTAASLDVSDRRPFPAGPRRLRAAGIRGLARRAVRQAAGSDPGIPRDRPARAVADRR